ncbi:hypothetical protein D3C75_979940 [compost metagenome]
MGRPKEKEDPGGEYVALEEFNFLWKPADVNRFDDAWKADMSIKEIALFLRRSEDEVAVLAMDRCIKKAIKPRKHGVFGKSDTA